MRCACGLRLQDKGKDTYSRYYEPHRSENEKIFGLLEEFGYEVATF